MYVPTALELHSGSQPGQAEQQHGTRCKGYLAIHQGQAKDEVLFREFRPEPQANRARSVFCAGHKSNPALVQPRGTTHPRGGAMHSHGATARVHTCLRQRVLTVGAAPW